MTRRPSYTHRQGVIYCGERAITLAKAREQLAADRAGAERCRAMGWRASAALSERFATELEQAIAAAEIFNRAGRPSPDQERVRLASVRRVRKAARQARGMSPALAGMKEPTL